MSVIVKAATRVKGAQTRFWPIGDSDANNE